MDASDGWRSVDKPLRAVVLYPLAMGEQCPQALRVEVGTAISVCQETRDWYLAHTLYNSGHIGLIPKSYVQILPPIGSSLPLVLETATVLREWNLILREKFLDHEMGEVKLIQDIMREVMNMRSSLIQSPFTKEETKEIQQKITTKIDFLNHRLDLDLIVRDPTGNALEPNSVAFVQLYRNHLRSAERIGNLMQTKPGDDVEAAACFKILMTLNSFTCPKVPAEVDLLFSVFEMTDGKIPRALCENFVVRKYSRASAGASKEASRPQRVLFADISKNDIANKQLFLVCNVVQEGNYNSKSIYDHPKSHKTVRPAKDVNFRKPVGVAVVEITKLFSFKQGKNTESLQMSAPFLASNDNESFDTVFRKLFFDGKLSEENGLNISFNISLDDISRPQDISIAQGHLALSRKIGLPEVILPSDFRNDLFLNISSGDFSRLDKRSDRNVEVLVEIVDENGEIVKGAISSGATLGLNQMVEDYFTTVVLYHEGKPRWNEIIKISIPSQQHAHKPGSLLTPISKDSFHVQTTLCSTKLTQNEGLLSLLKWRDNQARLDENINIFNQKVNGKEFAKFLPDVLDALFSILTDNENPEKFDLKVFKSLVNVIHLITEDARYQQFLPVLDMYIQENFSATLAYTKLLVVLSETVEEAVAKWNDTVHAAKSLKYILRFVVRSRELFSKMFQGKGREPFEENLCTALKNLVHLMSFKGHDILPAKTYVLKNIVQAVPDLVRIFDMVKLTQYIIDMVKAIPEGQLIQEKIVFFKALVHSELFVLPSCRSVMMPEMCESIFRVLDLKGSDRSEPTLCSMSRLLGDILISFQRLEEEIRGSTIENLELILNKCLRGIIQNVANRQPNDLWMGEMVANMMCILIMMSENHYIAYVNRFDDTIAADRSDLIDFIMEALGMIRDLVQNNPYPSTWVRLISVQNCGILRTLTFLTNTIRDVMKSPFEYQIWCNFFQCAITFITQPLLQVESYSEGKKAFLLAHCGDLRLEMGLIVKKMWFNLGKSKFCFVPEMVGPFLEITLIPHTELRRNSIPIFFDMMQCEYYSSSLKSKSGEQLDTKRDSTLIRANFKLLEGEVIKQLDTLIESGLGDEHYMVLFNQIMMSHCQNHTSLKESGSKFVRTTTKLMEILLEYRTTLHDEGKEVQMYCVANLLKFYESISSQELYVKYIKKLGHLHESCHNWAEAGCTLLQFANLLEWSDRPVRHEWRGTDEEIPTQRVQKELLYKEIAHLWERGQLWERAIDLNKELIQQHELITYEYSKLSELYQKMSQYYQSITNDVRPEPEYFRVAFYGRSFPKSFQNREFIFRGRPLERLPDFVDRIRDVFPLAELMSTLQALPAEEKERPIQKLLINKVDPEMRDSGNFGKNVHCKILDYYKVNNVNTFTFSRPVSKGTKTPGNEFANLWLVRTRWRTAQRFPGILQQFEITEDVDVFELSPLDVAIENMEKTNEELKRLILEHQYVQNPPLNPLSMKLKGIIEAHVMGGTKNYENVFFVDQYLMEHPDDDGKVRRLKSLIADQIPILEVGLKIHEVKKTDNLKAMHDSLQVEFLKRKIDVETKYGSKTCEIRADVVFQQRKSIPLNQSNSSSESGYQRTSDQFSDLDSSRTSIQSDATTRSKVLTAMGITRKKSHREENRNSFNRLNSSFIASVDEGGDGTSFGEYPQLIITQTGSHANLDSSPMDDFRPPSRSPSMLSYTGSSFHLDNGSGTFPCPPPPIPPKHRLSDQSIDQESDGGVVSKRSTKKKPPPPPPIEG
eukprot:maker-scaffold1210_size55525-snap-gene-0.17 protein:Tk07920 transcript:maker-scaffold1210_size55525-snap-gene-0.17-mRNA-1 annotation:"dedicator of cytokinesis protein 1 isoform x3"